ncbi:hypothetical protein SADUNF_Sadunf16G0162300 [Salix dunnii]|uniref:Uncharacterized protein n=1 Tax=Salix dunnii TaxID=1413687 RepID=A0A835MJ88_9ROSI|nr:hypothetical protein SADUNF_Sadunf16G0162300 [Salix dunnii]
MHPQQIEKWDPTICKTSTLISNRFSPRGIFDCSINRERCRLAILQSLVSASARERQKMASGARLCLCLLLVFVVISSARNTISVFSDADNEMALAVKGRSLKVTLNDYGDPVANRGHDPSQRNKNWGGRKG